MALIRANLAEMYTPIYDKFWKEGYGEIEAVCLKFFEELSDKTIEMKLNQLSELTLYQGFGELESVPQDNLKTLYPVILKHKKFGKRIEVSYEAVDDEEYALLSKTLLAKEYGRQAKRTKEFYMTKLIANAFTASADYHSQEGASVAICGDHTTLVAGTIVNNKITTQFSHDALEEMEQKVIDNARNSRGDIIPLLPRMKYLVCHPKLLRRIQRVLSERAERRPDVTSGDITVFAGTYQPLSLPYLAQFSGTEKYWGLVIPQGGLVITKREDAGFTGWVNNDIKSYVFDSYMRFVVGVYDWRAIWMSDGSV